MQDWYALAGGSGFSAPGPPQSMPLGMSPAGLNMFNTSGVSNAAWLGGGQAGGGNIIQQLLPLLGPMLGINLNLAPTGGSFSPIGRGIMESQQRELRSATQMVSESSQLRQGRELSAFLGKITNANVRPQDVSKITGTLDTIQNNPAFSLIEQIVPGITATIKDVTGGSSAAALSGLFNSSRVQAFGGQDGFNARSLARVMNLVNDRFSDEKGVRDLSFTQGLNVEDIAGGLGAYMQNFSVDESTLRDDTKITKFIEDANKVTASLRDLFGPNGSVAELYQNLEQLTQGGMNQMSPDRMRAFVDRLKMTTIATGMSPEMMQALVAQGSTFATQLGLPGVVGAEAIMESSLITSGVLRTRQQGNAWGQLSSSQLANASSQLSLGTISGVEANALGALARFTEEIGEGTPQRIRDIVERGRSGNLTSEDIALLRSPGILRDELAGVAGITEQGAMAFLENRTQNSRYFNEFQKGLNNIQGDALKRSILDNISGVNNLSPEDRERVFNALIDNNNRDDAVASIAEIIGGDNAAIQAAEAYEVITSRMGGRTTPIDIARALLGGEHDKTKSIVEEMERRERVLTDAGIGRGGGMLSRIGQRLISTEPLDTDDLFATIMGAPTGEMANIIRQEVLELGNLTGLSANEATNIIEAQKKKLTDVTALITKGLDENLTEEERQKALTEAREKELALDEDVDFQFSRALLATRGIEDEKKRRGIVQKLVESRGEALAKNDVSLLETAGIPGLSREQDLGETLESIAKFIENISEGKNPIKVEVVNSGSSGDTPGTEDQ